MAEKHYQNDYKKLLAVDESRTASEKLLDKALRNTKNTGAKLLEQQEDLNAGRKIIKKEPASQSLTLKDILDKIGKSVSSRDPTRILKGLSILEKCVQSHSFTHREIHQSYSIINTTVDALVNPQGTATEATKISQKLIFILQAF